MAVNIASAASSALGDPLQGIWTGKRTSDSGTELNQTLDISGTKITYTLATLDGDVRLVAKGSMKLEKAAGLHVMKFTDIEAGRSESELQAVGEERTIVYLVDDDRLSLANSFDRVRDGETPRVDSYTLKERKKAATGAEALAGKWKATVKMGDDDREYDLSFAVADGQLSGMWISPRSGEHKLRQVKFEAGKLTMELAREIQGNEAVFAYEAVLKDGALSGSFVVKGYEDQYKGTWSAKKD